MTGRGKWTPEQDQRLREMTRDGLDIGAIAWDLGRSEGAVFQRRDALQARGALVEAPAPRPCLKCTNDFTPAHKGNFVCTSCRKVNEHLSGGLDV